MKKPLLTLALFAMGVTLFAQKDSHQNRSPKAWHKAQMERIQKMTASQTFVRHKSTELKQRVVAQSFYDGTTLGDSTAYTYSEERGSQFNVYNLDFGYKHRFDEYFEPYNYPDGSSFIDLLADSIKNFAADPNNNYGDFVGYYTGDQLDSFICIKDGTLKFKNIKTYNPLGVLETSLTVDYNPDPTESMKQVNIYEDNSTRILSDSIYYKHSGNWELNEYTVYHYNAANQIDSISNFRSGTGHFDLENLLALTYNGNGKIEHSKAYINDGAGNMILEQETFLTYHPIYEGYSTFKWDEYEDGILLSTVDARCIFGANGKIDSIVGTVHDHDEDTTEEVLMLFTYNDFGNPVKLEQRFDDVVEGSLYFYYEDYEVMGISMKKKLALEMYPNPVNDKLIIQNVDQKLNGSWNINLMDIQGRTVFKQQQNLHSGENLIMLPELPAGIYLLHLESATHGKMSKKIVKQ